jgi:aspartate aminotransferase
VAVSATLAINERVAAKRRAGEDVVPLGFGEAGLPVHRDLVDALAAAGDQAAYGPVAGLPAVRVAAAGYLSRRGVAATADEVIVAPGSKPLLFAVIHAVDGAVVLPRPSWVSYAAQAHLIGRTVRHVPTLPGQGGVPDPNAFATAIADQRRAGDPVGLVVLTLPDNPTGTYADAEVVRAVCEVAAANDVAVVSDEIYRDLVHDGAPTLVSPATLLPDRTVVTGGLSKNLALGGWRLGFAHVPAGPWGEQVHARMLSVASEVWSCPPHPVQVAAAVALHEPPPLRERIDASRRLHARVVTAVADRFRAAGADVPTPRAAFYVYPDLSPLAPPLQGRWGVKSSDDLATSLLTETGIATLPGSAFADLPDRLTLRVATALLYGDRDDQRLAALEADDPTTLPWIAEHLERLDVGLTAFVSG